MNNQEMIAEFGRKIGMPKLALKNEGTCSLLIGDDMDFTLEGEHNGTSLRISAAICPLVEVDKVMMKTFLMVNHHADTTAGGAISIDPRSLDISLVRVVDVSRQSVDEFTAILNAMAHSVAFWIEHIPKMERENSEAPHSADEDIGLMLRL